MKNKWLFFLLLLLLPWQCVDPFVPDLKENENLLVVEGTISNGPGPCIVKLSVTQGLNYPFPEPLPGAIVTLFEEGGEQETLLETTPGVYETSPSGIQGKTGKNYKIAILTEDGGEYESVFEKILPAEPIDDVYAEVERRIDPNYAYQPGGYQFYVDASILNPENKYFLWKLTETYKFNSDLIIPFYFAGATLPFPKPDSLFTCYKTSEVRDIFVFDARRLANANIQRFPLHFADTEDRRLFLRYSLLVKQYSISREAYAFWSQIKTQNSALGALYTSQPFQIRGNIKNLQKPEEAVLGYFMAAGYSEKRIFVGPPPGIAFHFGLCAIGEPEIFELLSLPRTNPSTWPIYLGASPGGGPVGVPDPVCVDCRLKNATIEKPDFWIE
jgi:hypothetical protein